LPNILVIDDDDDLRDVLCEALDEAGYTVHAANDGSKGLPLAEREPIDLVVTDILMPGKEGIETIRELRRVRPDIRIIAISGGGKLKDTLFLEAAAEFGADATLKKPFRVADFLETIERVLAK
jgi:DNA-binding response OmpR family regulator